MSTSRRVVFVVLLRELYGMNRALTISIILVLTALAASLVYCLTIQPRVESTADGVRSETASSSQMPQATNDFQNLMALIDETIETDGWTVIGKPTRVVQANELIETEPPKADHVLALELFRGGTLLATQTRYFANYRGTDMEIPQTLPRHLACAMYANGFLSGSSSIQGQSDRQVAVTIDWVFDEKSTTLRTEFESSFVATVAESGVIAVDEDATIHWKFDANKTDQYDQPKPR